MLIVYLHIVPAPTTWLTSKGVRMVGTDAWSWDAPFYTTAKVGQCRFNR
jgi:hypothetical protein